MFHIVFGIAAALDEIWDVLRVYVLRDHLLELLLKFFNFVLLNLFIQFEMVAYVLALLPWLERPVKRLAISRVEEC